MQNEKYLIVQQYTAWKLTQHDGQYYAIRKIRKVSMSAT